MTGPLLPERLEELLAGYVLGNLSAQEAEEFRQLLAENPELGLEINHLQEVLELMPYALPEVAVPQHLRSVILEVANVSTNGNSTPKRSLFSWKKIAGSIAAVLILALGFDNYRLRQQLSTIQAQAVRQKDVIAMLQNPNTHLVSLKGMDIASAASGSIVITPGEQNVALVLQNLPILPKGQSYHLWAVVNDEKVSWGQFKASSKGKVLVKLPIRSSFEISRLVVTVEVLPEPRTPAGPMVMTSNLSDSLPL